MTSVIVVTKTLDAKAGSILIFLSDTGTNIPNSPATIIFSTIETPINKDNSRKKTYKFSFGIGGSSGFLCCRIRSGADYLCLRFNF